MTDNPPKAASDSAASLNPRKTETPQLSPLFLPSSPGGSTLSILSEHKDEAYAPALSALDASSSSVPASPDTPFRRSVYSNELAQRSLSPRKPETPQVSPLLSPYSQSGSVSSIFSEHRDVKYASVLTTLGASGLSMPPSPELPFRRSIYSSETTPRSSNTPSSTLRSSFEAALAKEASKASAQLDPAVSLSPRKIETLSASGSSMPPSPITPLRSGFDSSCSSTEWTPRSLSDSPYVYSPPQSSHQGVLTKEANKASVKVAPAKEGSLSPFELGPHCSPPRLAACARTLFSTRPVAPTPLPILSPPFNGPQLHLSTSADINYLEVDQTHVAALAKSEVEQKRADASPRLSIIERLAKAQSERGIRPYFLLGSDGYFHDMNNQAIKIPKGKMQYVIFAKSSELHMIVGVGSHFYISGKALSVILAGEAEFDASGHLINFSFTDQSGTYNPNLKSPTQKLAIYATQISVLRQLKIFPMYGLTRPFDPTVQAAEEEVRQIELKKLAEHKQEDQPMMDVSASSSSMSIKKA